MNGIQHVRRTYKTERGLIKRLYDDLGFDWKTIHAAMDAARRHGTAQMSKSTEATLEIQPDGFRLSAVRRVSRPARTAARRRQ